MKNIMLFHIFNTQYSICCRLKVFKASLLNLYKKEHAQTLPVAQIKEFVNKENAGAEFSEGEFNAAVEKMQDDNQIMMAEGMLILI